MFRLDETRASVLNYQLFFLNEATALVAGFKLAIPLSTDQIWSAHRVFWDSYCAAAQDCGLPHRAFSTIVADSLPGVSDTHAFAMLAVPISDL